MTAQLREIAAKLRNTFAAGEFRRRYTDGDKKDQIQVETHNGRVVEKKEAFPYGFLAKAKSGKVFVLCQGGNLDGFEIFPIQPGDDITPPELEEGDTALYTGGGARIVLRESGGIEIGARAAGNMTAVCEDGKFYIANGNKNICGLLIGLIDEIKAIVTSGAPPSHTINPTSQQKLEAYKNQIKALFLESA
jgi:phage gp45-like